MSFTAFHCLHPKRAVGLLGHRGLLINYKRGLAGWSGGKASVPSLVSAAAAGGCRCLLLVLYLGNERTIAGCWSSGQVRFLLPDFYRAACAGV